MSLRWLAVCAVALLPLAGSCLKEKDSLVIVGLTADTSIPGPVAVRITVGDVTRTFDIAAGLGTSMAVRRGVYVDSKATGELTVQAEAQVGTSPCVLYRSMAGSTVAVAEAGLTVETSVVLLNAGTCTGGVSGTGTGGNGGGAGIPVGAGGTAGGTGGTASGAGGTTGGAGGTTGGTGGTTGGTGGTTGGTGGRGAGGSSGGTGGANGGTLPPSLATCREFVHSAGTDCLGFNDAIIYSVAVAPNGTLVATAGADSRTKIWRFDGRTLTPEGHVLSGTGFGVAAFSPDGATLAIGWSTGIDLWNVSNWTRLRTLTTTSQVYDLAFTPDGSQIISIDSSTLYAHGIANSMALHSVAITDGAWVMAVSPAAVNLPVAAVATSAGTVQIFTHSSSGFTAVGAPLIVNPARDRTLSVRFSRDGTLLAAGSDDGLVHIWNYPIVSTTPTTPDVDVVTPTQSININMIDFSPSGRYLAVAGGGSFPSLGTWNTAAPRAIVGSYINPASALMSVTFSPSGAALIAGEYSCGTVLVCAD